MKLLDFLRLSNSAQPQKGETNDLDHERQALLAELSGVLELLGETNTPIPQSPEELRALNLEEIFGSHEAGEKAYSEAVPPPPHHQLARSLLMELRQGQQRIVGNPDEDFAR